jgi:predicted DNA-binding transcriptional regulator YafY
MSTNLHAAMRYAVIDKCLKDKERVYKWKDIAMKCLEEIKNFDENYRMPSKRQIYYDFENMKSGKLGYEAPIVSDKINGIYYADRKFTIYKSSLNPQQTTDLHNAVNLLKQLLKNTNLKSVMASLDILREKLNLALKDDRQYIHFEESLNEKGINWIDTLYNACCKKQTISVTYEPFDKPKEIHILSPYFIKEYNNRWYIIGYSNEKTTVLNLACDRIIQIKNSISPFEEGKEDLYKSLYQHVYGITILPEEPVYEILFTAHPLLAKYLTTKPIHSSQKLLSTDEKGSMFSLNLIINYEIIQKFLGYGSDVRVIEPQVLCMKLKEHLSEGITYYDDY